MQPCVLAPRVRNSYGLDFFDWEISGNGRVPRQKIQILASEMFGPTPDKSLGCSCNPLLARAAPLRYSSASSNPSHFRVLSG
jgi:hypothetical protein